MDDPIFEPWGDDAPPAPEPVAQPQRWRAPASVRYTPPVAKGERLVGVRGFLRTMATPRLEALADRLREARHEARVADLLAEEPPLLRMEMRPWKGPLDGAPALPFSTMEVELEQGAPEAVVFRMWVDPTVAPDEEVRVPAAKVGGAWVDECALRFVEGVLGRV